MADTVSAHKDADEYAEIVDGPAVVERKVADLARLVKQHRGRVLFVTGAGISTACGIPDFRSGLGSATGLPAGKWAQQATETSWSASERAEQAARAKRTSNTLCAIPSASHMALVALQRAGVTNGLISQNCDGLHRRSGFPSADLAEMHGCGNLEYCPMCGQEYLRDFQATLGRRTCGARLKREMWPEHSKLDLINPRKGNHYTGRRCTVPGCAGWLFDSTIDFGDNLPERALDKAAQLTADATLCVVIGSRCAVTPAADFPISVGERKGGTLVVVNLQRTAADGVASLRIGAKIDDVMVPLMAALGVPIPRFELRRSVRLRRSRDGAALEVAALDDAGLPADHLFNVQACFAANPSWRPPRTLPARVRFNQDTAPGRGPKGGRGGGLGARLANGASGVRLPAPGDVAELATLPCDNAQHPGKVEVAMSVAGRPRGAALAGADRFDVSPDLLEVLDERVRQPGHVVVNAGAKHGRQLSHRVPMEGPAAAAASADVAPVHLISLALHFRCHYLEPPLPLPLESLPALPGETVLLDLAYAPSVGSWTTAFTREAELDSGDIETSDFSELTEDKMQSLEKELDALTVEADQSVTPTEEGGGT